MLAATGGKGVDLVLNALNGEFIPRSLAALGSGGTFVEIGKAGIWTSEQMASARPDVVYVPFYLADLGNAAIGAMLAALMKASQTGRSSRFHIVSSMPRTSRTRSASWRRRSTSGRSSCARHRPPPSSRSRSGRRHVSRDRRLGALGLTIARSLVDRGARTLALVGRKEPSEEQRRAVTGIAGSRRASGAAAG